MSCPAGEVLKRLESVYFLPFLWIRGMLRRAGSSAAETSLNHPAAGNLPRMLIYC